MGAEKANFEVAKKTLRNRRGYPENWFTFLTGEGMHNVQAQLIQKNPQFEAYFEQEWTIASIIHPNSRRIVSGPWTESYKEETNQQAITIETYRLMRESRENGLQPGIYRAVEGFVGPKLATTVKELALGKGMYTRRDGYVILRKPDRKKHVEPESAYAEVTLADLLPLPRVSIDRRILPPQSFPFLVPVARRSPSK